MRSRRDGGRVAGADRLAPRRTLAEDDLAGLTTHVLDVARGCPAERVRVELYELAAAGGRSLIADVWTNADGRTDAPLISATEARAGRFELLFHAGDYFRRQGANWPIRHSST